jgi:hypothetical protein
MCHVTAVTHENRAEGMGKKIVAQYRRKFSIGETLMVIIVRGVIRKIVQPAATCTTVSPNWKQTLHC